MRDGAGANGGEVGGEVEPEAAASNSVLVLESHAWRIAEPTAASSDGDCARS